MTERSEGVDQDMSARPDPTPAPLHVFGNKASPRLPRADVDFLLQSEDEAVPIGELPLPKGASAFGDPEEAGLSGHYHVLPAGTRLPEGLAWTADGPEVVGAASPHPETHHTIYATREMPLSEFRDKMAGLPWKYAGKIKRRRK